MEFPKSGRGRRRWSHHCLGDSELLRYADDTLAVCEYEDEAQRLMRVLPRRLAQFGLRLNTQKTRLRACDRRHARRLVPAGQRLPTLACLGLPHEWELSRQGKGRLTRQSSKTRLRRALVAANQWLRQERNERKFPELWPAMGRKLRGHFNDLGVTHNSRALSRVEQAVRQRLFTWLNRRSQRCRFS
jgi:hypothetical protein